MHQSQFQASTAPLHPPSTMKLIVFIAVIIEAGLLFQAQAEAPQEYGAPSAPAPYPPSGWRPQGERFLLPAEFLSRYVQPREEYGPPPTPPPPVPSTSTTTTTTTTTTTEAETTTTDQPTTTEIPTTTEPTLDGDASFNREADQSRGLAQLREEPRMVVPLDSGVYYVYLPDGRLQRVNYITRPVAARLESAESNSAHQLGAGYQTQISYQDVQPLTGPIYQYGSPFMRIYRK